MTGKFFRFRLPRSRSGLASRARRSTSLGSIKSAKLIAPVSPRLRKKTPLGTDREMLPRPPSRVRCWRRDCVAGHEGLELRNVVAKYPLERSCEFPGIQPNSGHGDYSRLSCGAGETQLGPNARISAAMLARGSVDRRGAGTAAIFGRS